MRIDGAIFEQACNEIIETILFCLPTAYKGTIFKIGGPPLMTAERAASGTIDIKNNRIVWGFSGKSEYAPPGKTWDNYRDRGSTDSASFGWCVEQQTGCTTQVKKSTYQKTWHKEQGGLIRFRHLEPVLIRKQDLINGDGQPDAYPLTHKGTRLWQDSEYVVAAIIKIHFLTEQKIQGSNFPIIIGKLSRAFANQLLSHQMKAESLQAMHRLAKDKVSACNMIADSLRNAISKSGLILSLIKLELGFLRAQWEDALLGCSDQREMKKEAVNTLNDALKRNGSQYGKLAEDLVVRQNRFLNLSLTPERGENWVHQQIEEKWDQILHKNELDSRQKKAIHECIDRLKLSLHLGKNPDLIAAYDKMPDALKNEWVELIYHNTDQVDFPFLERMIKMLENPSLNLPCRDKSRKSLKRLKALAEIMEELEQNTNMVLREVLNGYGKSVLLDYASNTEAFSAS